MAFSSLLWPLLICLGAAGLIPRLRPWVAQEGRTYGVLLASVVAFLALLVVAPGAAVAEPWTFSSWGGAVGLGQTIQLRVDPLGIAFMLMVGIIGMATFVGSLDEPIDGSSYDYQAGLLVFLAGLLALGLADNLLTFLLAGLLLDAGLLYGIGLAGRPRWFLVLSLHSLVAQGLVLMAVLFLWRESGTTFLADGNERVLLLVVGAAIARMAPLPFSLIPVAFERLPQRVLALLPLVTLGAGGLMLGRVAQAIEVSVLPDFSGLASVAALGVGLAGWVAWRREEPSVRLMMLSAFVAAWVLWAFSWGLPGTAVATAWSGTLALGALAIHGGRVDFRHGSQIPALLAAVMLIGFPGSAMWVTMRTVGGLAWLQQNQWAQAAALDPTIGRLQALANAVNWLPVVAALGVMGAVAALLQWMIVEESETYQQSRWVGITLLALLSVPFLAALAGIRVPDLLGPPLPALPLAAQLVVLIIGWAGGLWLWRVRLMLHPLHPFLDGASSFFSFVWLWRILGRIGWLLLSGLRGMMLVLEGENYGWLLLFLFVTLVFLVQR